MKPNTSQLIRLGMLLVLAVGGVSALSSYSGLGGSVVRASCTRSGTASYLPDGTPACDCTSTANGGNCSCIVKCPEGGGSEEMLGSF